MGHSKVLVPKLDEKISIIRPSSLFLILKFSMLGVRRSYFNFLTTFLIHHPYPVLIFSLQSFLLRFYYVNLARCNFSLSFFDIGGAISVSYQCSVLLTFWWGIKDPPPWVSQHFHYEPHESQSFCNGQDARCNGQDAQVCNMVGEGVVICWLFKRVGGGVGSSSQQRWYFITLQKTFRFTHGRITSK